MNNNEQLRAAYENDALDSRAYGQIQKDIWETAQSMGVDQDDPEFLDSFWDNYDPETDGVGWVRE